MKEVEQFPDPTKKTPAKASLAKVKSESESERAARYFAMHGMKKIGHALGDELSAQAEKKAEQEQQEAQKKINVNVAVPASQSSQSSQDLEMPDDDDDASYKKQWALVDKLKQRRHI